MGAATLLLAGCAGADEPGAAAESTETAAGAADAVESSCPGGVTLAWQGEPETQDLFTAAKVAKVGAGGTATTVDEWDRGEKVGAKPASGSSDDQKKMVTDAVTGGLVGVTPAPKLADVGELLDGRDQGKYVLYAYARHSSQDATVSCADGSDSVEVAVTSFKTLETGVANCQDTPDPVAEFAAADAIGNYCDRG